MSDETKDQLKIMLEGVTAVQKKIDELEKNGQATDATIKEETEKARKAVTDAVEEMQTLKAEAEAQKKFVEDQKQLIEDAQKEIARLGTGGDTKTITSEYDGMMARYMKKGILPDDEQVGKICEKIASASTFGMNDVEISQYAKSLAAGSNPDGGFFIIPERSDRMSERLFPTSNARPLVNIETTTSDVYEIILDDGETDCGWVGEVDERPDTNTAKIGLIKIPIHEIYSNPKATQKMLDDAGFDVAAWHEKKVVRDFSRKENVSFVAGDGSAKPKGMLTYPNWTAPGVYQRNAVEQLESAEAVTVTGDDLIKLQGLLIEEYHPMAQWAMSRRTFFDNVLTLKAEDGTYLINPRLIAEGAQMVILGKPVNFFNDMPVVAANSLSVLLADF